MNPLKEIDAIIHTGYSISGYPGVSPHPRQEELRRLWLARMQSQSGRDDYLALYFPSRYGPNLHGGLDKKDYPFDVADEVIRINQYRSILGNKLIILKGGILPSDRRGWERLLRRHGFYFNPERLKINAFGELYDDCVEVWSCSLADVLGLKKERVSKIRDLSVNSSEDNLFHDWQQQQYKKLESLRFGVSFPHL